MNDAFLKLSKHLDNLPAGFPATDSGVELRILKRLFSAREAEIAVGLTMKPEPVAVIADRLDLDESDLKPILESMSKKGLIFRMQKKGETLFMAAQFIVGIWEYHVNDLDEALIKDVNEYIPHLMKKRWAKQKTKQLRVIPVSKSISAEMSIMPYEAAEDIIKKQSKILVAPCICRKEHKMVGKGCDRPMEACLIFGSAAYYYHENGLGRFISQTEALDLLNQGQEAGLVLQPGNAQKTSNICMCCGCCCQILKNLKTLENPSKASCSNYLATINDEDCTACGTCVERCQMDAIALDDVALIDDTQCIGCGLCVPACESEAIQLREKPEADRWVPPTTTLRTYVKMARERGKI